MHQTQISKNPKPNNTAAGMQRIYTYLGFFLSPKILNPDANNTAAGMERICVSLLG